jgi:tRNA A58 N-methylase Trm61
VLVGGKRLTGPLNRNERHNVKDGFIAHKDIIGRPSAGVQLKTNTGVQYAVSYPSFEDYVSLAPRKVTPIYASYSSSMLSLLDIHVAPPTSTNQPSRTQPPLEILESGTGHGSLTLHLSRAIAAANPPPPLLSADDQSWTAWKRTRRAILHSVEINDKTSAHAQKLIKGFRQGLYFPHIDFSVSDVASWADSRQRKKFLSYVILDMPGVHGVIENVVPAMKDDAVLMIFVPSITQIGDCVRIIKDRNLPLEMMKVTELGEGLSNGRLWDVRLVQKRAQQKKPRSGNLRAHLMGVETAGADPEGLAHDRVEAEAEMEAEDAPVMVCRPKPGEMTMGCCYIGMWRRSPDAKSR